MKETNIEQVGSKVVIVRNTQVIIDRDVADIYGVTTREINQAVKNNPEKFPKGYVFELEKQELADLQSKNLIANSPKNRAIPKAFTEKGLYMLATIIKSKVATEATIAIIETYTKIRELARAIEVANERGEVEQHDQSKIQKLMTEAFTNNLPVTMKKTTFSINTGIIKFSIETTRTKED